MTKKKISFCVNTSRFYRGKKQSYHEVKCCSRGLSKLKYKATLVLPPMKYAFHLP